MRALRRGFWLLAQLVVSALALARALWLGRGAYLVFTHEPDLDDDGYDRQLGPLLAALEASRARGGRPLVEASYVPLDGRALRRQLRARRRPFLSHACLLAAARLLAACGTEREAARLVLARGLLAFVRPSALFVIDESGSGQPLVRAARRLRIPALGIQHGDVAPGDSAYDPAQGTHKEPADLFCAWSPWFRARLLALSRIYDEQSTLVTGRLRRPGGEPRAAPARSAGDCTVLLLPGPGERTRLLPVVAALRAAPGLRLQVRPHPAERETGWPGAELVGGALEQALGRADVAAGLRSSALLEALHARRPVLQLGAELGGYGELGLCPISSAGATEAAEALQALARRGWDGAWESVRERVWGGDPADPAAAVLGAAETLLAGRSSPRAAGADPPLAGRREPR